MGRLRDELIIRDSYRTMLAAIREIREAADGLHLEHIRKAPSTARAFLGISNRLRDAISAIVDEFGEN